MAERPWLTILGLGEDGLDGVSSASLAALDAAEIVMGPSRHLGLLPDGSWNKVTWPVPFAEGVEQLLSYRGQPVVVLASGDPFWFGAGRVLAERLEPGEWAAHPGPSCFSLAANALGWSLETTLCLGLHAAPLTRLRPDLSHGQKLIVTLRDGAAPVELAKYLQDEGFGRSHLHVFEALGGPRERRTSLSANAFAAGADFTHPLCVAIEVQGGAALPKTNGLADDWFEHDGQITKRPVRALTLSSLAPRYGEHLWDIGSGSGSIAIEWLLSDRSLSAVSIEVNEDRADRIRSNAVRLGVDRLDVVTGRAPDVLDGLDLPSAVFVGGGLTQTLLDYVTSLPAGTRLVINAVTLEAETLLAEAHTRLGGDLLRIDLSQAAPLGSKRGWRVSFPIVQWSAIL